MRTHRVWIEIVIFGSGMACLLATLLVIIVATAGAAVGQLQESGVGVTADSASYEGMVTCSRCGAKHSASLNRAASVCVRVCVHGGAKFALVNADSTYLLQGHTDALKRIAGQRATIVGSLEGNTIKVQSVASGH